MYNEDMDFGVDPAEFRPDNSFEHAQYLEELQNKLRNGEIKPISDTTFMSREDAYHETFKVLGNAFRELLTIIENNEVGNTQSEFKLNAVKLQNDFKSLATIIMRKAKEGTI